MYVPSGTSAISYTTSSPSDFSYANSTVPTHFTVELSYTKKGKNVYYVLGISGFNPNYKPEREHITNTSSDSSSVSSQGSSNPESYPYIRYEVWRAWQDCLIFIAKVEEKYAELAREKRSRLRRGLGPLNSKNKSSAGSDADSIYQSAASFASLPMGPEPNSIPKSVFSILPKVTNTTISLFSTPSDEVIKKNLEEFKDFLNGLFNPDDDVPSLIVQVREEPSIRGFFGVHTQDTNRWKLKAMESRSDKGKEKMDPARAMQSGSGIMFSPSDLSLPLPTSGSRDGSAQERQTSTSRGHSRSRPRSHTVGSNPHLERIRSSFPSPHVQYSLEPIPSSAPPGAVFAFTVSEYPGDNVNNTTIGAFQNVNAKYEQAPPSMRRRAAVDKGKGKARAVDVPIDEMDENELGQELIIPPRNTLRVNRGQNAFDVDRGIRHLTIHEEDDEQSFADSEFDHESRESITSVPWLHGPPRRPGQRPTLSQHGSSIINSTGNVSNDQLSSSLSTYTGNTPSLSGGTTTTSDCESPSSLTAEESSLAGYRPYPRIVKASSAQSYADSYLNAFYAEGSGVASEEIYNIDTGAEIYPAYSKRRESNASFRSFMTDASADAIIPNHSSSSSSGAIRSGRRNRSSNATITSIAESSGGLDDDFIFAPIDSPMFQKDERPVSVISTDSTFTVDSVMPGKSRESISMPFKNRISDQFHLPWSSKKRASMASTSPPP